jgi:hypothetical protein
MLWVQAAPEIVTLEPVAPEKRSSLPSLQVKVLMPIGMLEVYDRVGTLIHHLLRRVKLLTNVTPPPLKMTVRHNQDHYGVPLLK